MMNWKKGIFWGKAKGNWVQQRSLDHFSQWPIAPSAFSMPAESPQAPRLRQSLRGETGSLQYETHRSQILFNSNLYQSKALPAKIKAKSPSSGARGNGPPIAGACKLMKFHLPPLTQIWPCWYHLLLDDKSGCFYCMVVICHMLPGQVSR